MAARKNHPRINARPQSLHADSTPPPIISPRWLLTAVVIALVGAAACAWATLCLLFWQGSWQLLYHPKATIARTPASVAIPFEPVGFAASETGQSRVQGWWIPAEHGAPLSYFTILYLHGAAGNLGDNLDALARFHALGANVLAFDYRGYGQSQFEHPGEATWIEDANWALEYLTQTRHTDRKSIVLAGSELGADLAIEVAADHPDLGGVIVDSLVEDPASVIFKDSRAHLVPAHLLVKDRYDVDAAAEHLRIPSLWLLPSVEGVNAEEPSAFRRITAQRQLVRLTDGQNAAQETDAIAHWLSSLPRR